MAKTVRLEDVDRLFGEMFADRDLVAIREATEAYARVVVPDTPVLDVHRDCLAEALCHRLTLYSVSDGAAVRPVGAEELSRGRFMEGARVLVFRDGREPLRNLAVERSALDAALGTSPPLEKK
jgi:hypothetical protein